jgi:hypothetical protein
MKYGKEEFGLGQSFLQKPEMKLLSCLQQNFHLFTKLKNGTVVVCKLLYSGS